jgi:hypothetical protein
VNLPGADRALVEPAKVRDYLLSSEHPIGRAKAHFFHGLGFSQERWPELQAALVTLARTGDAVLGEANPFGQKYLVRGILQGPRGHSADTVTVWIILHGEAIPRLVTAYPGVSA